MNKKIVRQRYLGEQFGGREFKDSYIQEKINSNF